MARSIGVVSKVVGQVFAVEADGSRRQVMEGDRLFAGEQLETGTTGAVAVHLNNGAELTLGRDSSLEMTPNLLANHAAHVTADDPLPSQAELSDVARLQRAIAAGDDPTQTTEEPAAGGNPGGGAKSLGGGHSFVLLTEVGDRVDPEVGFPTAGFNYLPEIASREIGGEDSSSRFRDTPPVTPPEGTPDHPVSLRGLDVNPGELILDEANLPLGSASNPAALTQHGSFTVVAPDGVFNLSVGGITIVTAGAVIGVGQSITTALGNTLTITGYNAQSGEVSYSYTLNTAEQHPDGGGINDLSEHFAVVASDTDGDVASGTLDVIIRDDVPTAVNDINAVPATEQHTQLTGNVLNNDIQGADRVTTGGPIVGGTFVGTYGTLVLAEDGSYTYTLNPNDQDFKNLHGGGKGVEVFTYTLHDADGDTSTATLTLNITNLDDPVTLGGLDVKGGELTVHESNLSDGSNPNPSALTQNGTFTVSAPDGLQTLSVGGISVVSGGVAAGFPQSITTPLGNTLTVTGYNAETGVASYSYTLLDNTGHPAGDGANSVQEQFTVVAQDIDGSTATASLDVNIQDDVPTAVNDINAVPATEQHTQLTGNVLTNDIQGADRVTTGGPIVGGTFVGTYGTLVLAEDGSYTYTLNPNDQDFKNLHGGGKGVEVFTYTLHDADGDTSTATLTLNITNLDDPVTLGGLDVKGGELTVHESNLSDGSNPNAAALTQNGTFTVSAPDGLQTLSVSGISVVSGGVAAGFPQSISTPLGNTLTITGYNAETGVVSYSYTLLDNTGHPAGEGANNVQEQFTVVAQDTDGSTATASLDVNIIDDVPQAYSDYIDVREGGTVSGNVLLNDKTGADVVSDGKYVVGVRAGSDTSTSAIGQLGVQIQGQYGYLTLDAAGNGVYHANPNSVDAAGGKDVFVYTIRDADGDESTTTITIDIKDSNLVACDDFDVKVYEKALDLIKDGNDLAPGTVVGSDPGSRGETGTGTLVGSVSGGTGPLTYTLVGSDVGQYGQIQINADGTYTYTLTSAPKTPGSPNNGPDIQTEHFTYQATDANGNSVTATIVVQIVDDVPKAHCDFARIVEGGTVSGNVLLNDTFGADVVSDGKYVVGVRAGNDTSTSAIGQLGVQIQGQYGYLTLDAEGNGVYHANPNSVDAAGGKDVFVYTIRDADGDESTTTITIDIKDSNLVACNDFDVKVYEKALDLLKDGNDLAPGTVIGSDPGSRGETGTGTLVGSVSGGTGPLTYTLVGSDVGQYGQIQINADGTYTYTLTSAPKTPGSPDNGRDIQTETFTYQATDAHGNSVSSHVVISIVDDVPQAVCAERSITPQQVDSNLLLVIDVSGSMNFPSGVQGLSRLDLTKQAINALLDRYDAMGDIKVQLVTFATGAALTTPQWVSLANAKSIVAGLTADGSTYYDSAVQKAMEAFKTAGKLEGGQNISYFFSDGIPTNGHALVQALEAKWEQFLDLNDVKSYAIGMGTGVDASKLDPLAYDGQQHHESDSVVVTDLSQLSAVLSGTVQGVSITGSLMSGGTFGADGGFIKALLVDGSTYTFDPKANGSQGGYSVAGGADKAVFDTASHTLFIKTQMGGTLVVDMDTGEFIYTPPKEIASAKVETFGFTASDNDGDTSSASLVVRINGNSAPVAVADHVITNITGPTITLPAAALLANDSDANHDRLSAAPTTFATNFAEKGAEFSGGKVPTIWFDYTPDKAENQSKDLARSAFVASSASMSAALVVAGFLGAVEANSANAQDTLTVTLRKGESLTLDHDRPAGNLLMEWKDGNGAYQSIKDGASFTASHDGVYSVHLVNVANADGSKAVENYKLSMTIDYQHAENEVYHGSYTVNDHHGGSATAALDITYQSGHTLNGTTGNDVLLATDTDTVLIGGEGNDVLVGGQGNDALYGGDGDDLLIGGAGNDLLDGGAGNDTASYATATRGVTVDLSISGAQTTGGAGVDTLTNIENLIGSEHNDILIGNAGDNVLTGGLGDDILTGGGGHDTFVWRMGDSGHDTVTDFTPGSDRLDLSQLLQGENATAASLDDYLHFKVSASGNTVISTLEVSTVAGAAPTQTIDLAGFDLAQHYGVTVGAGGFIAAGHDTATVINGMLGDHSLKVDTV